jgi:hypothetical protein
MSYPDEIRRTIRLSKTLQDDIDFEKIKVRGADKMASKAIYDILESEKVPILRDTLQYKRKQSVETVSILSKSSSIPTLQQDGSKAREYIHSQRYLTAEQIRSGEARQNKLSQALLFMNLSKEILDSSRLMFEAASLFDELMAYERAADCYLKSTKLIDPGVVVDTYDLPEDEIYRRKVERMSNFRVIEFKENRKKLRDSLIFEESERQRLRARASFCHLLRIYLLELKDLKLAHMYLCQAFKSCANTEEHNELLYYTHFVIKAFAVSVLSIFYMIFLVL